MTSFGRQFYFHDVIYHLWHCNADNRRRNVVFTTTWRSKCTQKYVFQSKQELWEIDPFPIIGFYLYHVISAGQSNNWTTSGMWSCNNLLLILNAFHLYLWRLKHKSKGKWQLYVAQLYMTTKRVNFISYLSNLRWTKPWRLLFKWYVYRHILPQSFSAAADEGPSEMTCFPAGLHYLLTFPTRMSKNNTEIGVSLCELFRERMSWSLRWYIAIYADFFKRENLWIV